MRRGEAQRKASLVTEPISKISQESELHEGSSSPHKYIGWWCRKDNPDHTRCTGTKLLEFNSMPDCACWCHGSVKKLKEIREESETLGIIEEILREHYPHGHPEFIRIAMEKIRLHSKKNYQYAHGGPPLGNLIRVGRIMELYPSINLADPIVVGWMYMMKHLDAMMWGLCHGHEPKEENLGDVSVYIDMIRCAVRDRATWNLKNEEAENPENRKQ